jgi:F0F1-type ATP synthase assembly protein I
MDSPTSKPKKKLSNNSFIQYTGMGFQILAYILIFIWLGYKLDGWIGLKMPVFTVVLSLVGVIAAMYSIIRKL